MRLKRVFSMVNINELTSSKKTSLEVFCSADVRYANNFVPPLGSEATTLVPNRR